MCTRAQREQSFSLVSLELFATLYVCLYACVLLTFSFVVFARRVTRARTVKSLSTKSLQLQDEMKEKWAASDGLVKQVTGDVYKELAFVKTQMTLVTLDAGTQRDMKSRIEALQATLQTIKSNHAPKTGSLFVRLMLGKTKRESIYL